MRSPAIALAFLALGALAPVATASPQSLEGPQSSARPGCLLSSKRLARCLDTAARNTAACGPGTTFRKKKANCLCKAYTDAAACWAPAECSEWHPTIVAVTAAIELGGGGGAVLPNVVNSLDHKFRPHLTHKGPSRKKRPFGVEPPLEVDDIEDVDGAAFLTLQGEESIFEYLPDFNEEGEMLNDGLSRRGFY
ncbi:hypothetical protein RQP46_000781 [Phenoliferia psychrophenolica]